MAARTQRSVWRFVATNTHLYPGAPLRARDTTARDSPAPGDTLIVEFADLGSASGSVVTADGERFVAAMAEHTTAKGTRVAARTWSIARDPAAKAAGSFKVISRRPDPAIR